MHDDRIMYLHM